MDSTRRESRILTIAIASIVALLIATCTCWYALAHITHVDDGFSFVYYMEQGALHDTKREYVEAVQSYSKALQLAPESAAALLARAAAYAHLHKYESMKADYEAAIRLTPDDARTYNNYCWYSTLLGHIYEVQDECQKAVSLAPTEGSYRDSRGLNYALRGNFARAIEDFQFFVDQNDRPDSPLLAEVEERKLWIAALKNDNNPFTPAELDKLLMDDFAAVTPTPANP